MEPRLVWLSIFALLHFQMEFSANVEATPRNFLKRSISRDHVSVWFASPLQEEVQYEKENLQEMINLVGGTFGTLVIPSAPQMPELLLQDERSNSVILIPSLVAKSNEKPSNKKMKGIVSFEMPKNPNPEPSIGQGQAKMQSSLQVAKTVADKANSIHPGTVDTLILIDNALSPNSADGKSVDFFNRENRTVQLSRINNYLRSAREILGKGPNKYKLGVLMSSHNFGKEESNSMLSEILQNVDLIIPFILDYDKNYLGLGNEHQSIRNIEHQVEQEKSGVVILPLISCKTPTSRDYMGISSFLHCWKFNSDWARENNRSVIMYEAFDQYGNHSPKDMGWWRLKSGKPLGNNQLLSQKINASSVTAKADEIFGLGLNTERQFGTHAAIQFDPRVRSRYRDMQYSKKEVLEMLELVSTRFSTIAINSDIINHHLDFNETTDTVAKMNFLNSGSPSSQQLKIIVNIIDNPKWNISQELDTTWKLAEHENRRFPGTVTTIAFHKFEKASACQVYWKDLKAALETQFSNRKDNTSSIRLATYVELPDCNLFKAEFSSVSKWVDVVLVDISSSLSPSLEDEHIYFALLALFAEWKTCKANIKVEYPKLDIRLSVACSKLTSATATSSIEHVAMCWELVNVWGEKNQVQIIFHQAFEVPYVKDVSVFNDKNPDPLGGWWKLKQKSEKNITAESFEETFKDPRKDSLVNEGGDVERNDIGLAIMFICLIVIFPTLIHAFILHLYTRKNATIESQSM